MARYLIMQMNGGVTQDGERMVSAANLGETHRPGITVPPDGVNTLPAILLPDTTEMHYALGWFEQTFKDGRKLLWHAGGIDGSASLMGFFPGERIGFVLLTNQEPSCNGALFNFSVQASLLSRLYGLNASLHDLLATFVPILAQQSAGLAARERPLIRRRCNHGLASTSGGSPCGWTTLARSTWTTISAPCRWLASTTAATW